MSDIKKIAESLINLKVKEINDLVKILKEDYGIEPSIFNDNKPIENIESSKKIEEKTSFNVILKSAGITKLAVIKLIKEITGLGLKESKELVDKSPKSIKENINKEDADLIKKKLEEAGAEVEIK